MSTRSLSGTAWQCAHPHRISHKATRDRTINFRTCAIYRNAPRIGIIGRRTHFPGLTQCEGYFCAITPCRSIVTLRLVYRAIFLPIGVMIIILRIWFFVPVAASTSRRRETAGVRYDETLETGAQKSDRGIKTNFAGTKSISSPHNASRYPPPPSPLLPPCNKHRVYMYAISPPVHPTYRVRCSAHTSAALSFRNPRDNAKQQREDAWKFSRELLPEAARLSPFVYLAFPQIRDGLCETVHASICISLFPSFPLFLFLSFILSIISLPRSVMSLTLMRLGFTGVLFIVG